MPMRRCTSGYIDKTKRFDITQHRYAGGDDEGTGGYIELLGIRDPPEGKVPTLIHFWGTGWTHTFWEFDSHESALATWGEHYWPRVRTLHEQPGCIRKVVADNPDELPWFFAGSGDDTSGDFFTRSQAAVA
jgi:hypothetical protein